MRNIFGLFRQYYAARFPDHDPDKNIVPNDLIDMSLDSSYTPPRRNYYPYSNQSSFLLGEWYWNDGKKKSQSSFQNLVKIIGHPEFRPEDIAGKNWQAIDAHLSGNTAKHWTKMIRRTQGDRVGHWIETLIKINIPFHKRMLNPGPKEFNAGILHHHQLTSVIREKLTRPSTHPHLHFEPYSFFGNQVKLLNQSKYMANCSHQRHLSRLITNSRSLLENRDVTSKGCDWSHVCLR